MTFLLDTLSLFMELVQPELEIADFRKLLYFSAEITSYSFLSPLSSTFGFGKKFITCQDCDKEIPLLDRMEQHLASEPVAQMRKKNFFSLIILLIFIS